MRWADSVFASNHVKWAVVVPNGVNLRICELRRAPIALVSRCRNDRQMLRPNAVALLAAMVKLVAPGNRPYLLFVHRSMRVHHAPGDHDLRVALVVPYAEAYPAGGLEASLLFTPVLGSERRP